MTKECSARVEKILPGGSGLLRIDGASVLVNNAVTGDLLQLNMQGKRRGVSRADIVSVVEASEYRVLAPCPVAEDCGGCALQFVAVACQVEEKSAWVKGAFKHLINEDTAWSSVEASDLSGRRRVRWFVGHDALGSFLGFYATATHQAVRHRSCMVITESLNEMRILIEKHFNLELVSSVQAVQLDDGMHIVIEADERPEFVYDHMLAIGSFKGVEAVQWWWRDRNQVTRPLQKPVRHFYDALPAGVEGQDVLLKVGPDDFVQGQRHGNRQLIGQIQQWAGQVHRIADFFCGIGNLSLPLSKATGAEVFGAELNSASVKAATANAKRLGLSAQFEETNLFEQFDKEAYVGADVLILDPPRRGAKRICSQMGQLMPKKIIMVSCDVAAGGRDGELLRQQGYSLKALRGLDLFPYAGHVEAMSLWEQQ